MVGNGDVPEYSAIQSSQWNQGPCPDVDLHRAASGPRQTLKWWLSSNVKYLDATPLPPVEAVEAGGILANGELPDWGRDH